MTEGESDSAKKNRFLVLRNTNMLPVYRYNSFVRSWGKLFPLRPAGTSPTAWGEDEIVDLCALLIRRAQLIPFAIFKSDAAFYQLAPDLLCNVFGQTLLARFN